MTDIDLAAPPFNLDAAGLAWVETTLGELSPVERLHQLFVLSARVDAAGFERIKAFQPGGLTAAFTSDQNQSRRDIAALIAASKVRPLISADLEGSRMSLPFGTQVPNPLALAAIDDLEATAEISRIMAEEGRAAGVDWSFTPVLDVNAAFRSAIVATRGFGSDVATIERHALVQMRVFQEHGIAATVKHWPGEGYDDRDQHLVTTVNPLTVEAWEESFGKLYRAAIGAGVLSVMSGHIAFPAFIRSLLPKAGLEAFRPASLSRHLNITLLRERLGFNGLIVSDATPMAGFGAWGPRHETIPQAIAAGCDVILFSSDPARDVDYLTAAIERGQLTEGRIEEAVRRILGLKAALNLHRPRADAKPVFANRANVAIARDITRRAPTLVKDSQNLLPLDPIKHRRVLVISGGIILPFLPAPMPFALPEMLARRGFEITMQEPDTVVSRERFDLVLYLFGDETLLTRNHIYLDWLRVGGNIDKAMERTWHDIPTLMISFGFPYLLYDAPRVPTYINAYATYEGMQEAVADALLGNVKWNRHSPVDPFCGLEDAKF